ncbi:24036_t:CDS:2, partial [Racocetra persica]
AFSYSSIRKRRWLKFLSSNIVSLEISLQLPPLFVKTRWNKNTFNDPPKLVKELARILTNHENISIIEMIIEFITLNAQP